METWFWFGFHRIYFGPSHSNGWLKFNSIRNPKRKYLAGKWRSFYTWLSVHTLCSKVISNNFDFIFFIFSFPQLFTMFGTVLQIKWNTNEGSHPHLWRSTVRHPCSSTLLRRCSSNIPSTFSVGHLLLAISWLARWVECVILCWSRSCCRSYERGKKDRWLRIGDFLTSLLLLVY